MCYNLITAVVSIYVQSTYFSNSLRWLSSGDLFQDDIVSVFINPVFEEDWHCFVFFPATKIK